MYASQYVQGELNEMMKQKITLFSPSNIVCLFVFLKKPTTPLQLHPSGLFRKIT